MIKIRQTLSAQVILQVAVIQPPAARAETVKKLQERYGFLKAPVTFEELFPINPIQGIRFEEGTFLRDGQPVVIELLHLLPNMLIAQTRTSTDDAEAFLEGYIENANQERADTIKPFGAPLYVSQIEFSSDLPLEQYAPTMKPVTEAIQVLLEGYKCKVPPYRVAGITVNFDFTGFGGIVPAHFSIERRSGVPHALNIFYSHAPLKTSDHVALLERLYRSDT